MARDQGDAGAVSVIHLIWAAVTTALVVRVFMLQVRPGRDDGYQQAIVDTVEAMAEIDALAPDGGRRWAHGFEQLRAQLVKLRGKSAKGKR